MANSVIAQTHYVKAALRWRKGGYLIKPLIGRPDTDQVLLNIRHALIQRRAPLLRCLRVEGPVFFVLLGLHKLLLMDFAGVPQEEGGYQGEGSQTNAGEV